MRIIFITFLFYALCSLIPTLCATAQAQDFAWEDFGFDNLYLTVGIQPAYIKGDNTYWWFSKTDVSESKLDFPLNNYLLGFEGVLGYKNRYTDIQDRIKFTLKTFTALNKGAGKSTDSDWLSDELDWWEVGEVHRGLDIYSEADAKLRRLNITDLSLVCNFSPAKSITLGALVGGRYQKFTYEIRDSDQVGYGPYAPWFTSYLEGRVSDYEVKYKFLYLGLNLDVLFEYNSHLNLKVGYSNGVKALDRDDHRLRYLLYRGDCQGDAYLVDLNLNWQLSSRCLLQLSGEYIKIDTEGETYAVYYDGIYEGITSTDDRSITSSFKMFSLGLAYRF